MVGRAENRSDKKHADDPRANHRATGAKTAPRTAHSGGSRHQGIEVELAVSAEPERSNPSPAALRAILVRQLDPLYSAGHPLAPAPLILALNSRRQDPGGNDSLAPDRTYAHRPFE